MICYTACRPISGERKHYNQHKQHTLHALIKVFKRANKSRTKWVHKSVCSVPKYIYSLVEEAWTQKLKRGFRLDWTDQVFIQILDFVHVGEVIMYQQTKHGVNETLKMNVSLLIVPLHVLTLHTNRGHESWGGFFGITNCFDYALIKPPCQPLRIYLINSPSHSQKSTQSKRWKSDKLWL